MLKEFSERLYERFRAELQEKEALGLAGAKRLPVCLQVVRKYLQSLRAEVDKAGFADAAEEMGFFKYEKPRFYCWLIYYQECFGIEGGLPLGDEPLRLAYYAETLRFINRFFRRHEFHYQYYRLAATELDHLYFIRGAAAPAMLTPEVPYVDPAFGTALDYLFSKFMAYEMVQGYVLEQMSGPVDGLKNAGMMSRKGVATRWTGDTCNLIELIYGIYETRQVNGGEVNLSDLMDVFEQVFQVNLSRYFRRFTEIKRRKTISKTKFLDQMREAVERRIDDSDALPAKGKGKMSVRNEIDMLRDNPYL